MIVSKADSLPKTRLGDVQKEGKCGTWFFKCLILVYILNSFNQINPEKGK